MDALVPTNCRTVYRERIIHVTQRSPRAHPELAQTHCCLVCWLPSNMDPPQARGTLLVPVLGKKSHFV